VGAIYRAPSSTLHQFFMDENKIQSLPDREEIIRTVVELFVSTDQREWKKVESCFAETVTLDMTSLAGGEPLQQTGAQVAESWRIGLLPIDQVHHQVSNFFVKNSDYDATVFCYGIAYHYRAVSSEENTRTFVGSYDIHLVKRPDGWKIDLFRFNLKFITGNLHLETAT
jgi:SnoaL-like domain